MSTVVGVFKQYSNAEVALDRLFARGFTLDRITAIVPQSAVPKGEGPVVPTAAANTQGVGNQPGILGLGGAVAGLKGTVMPAMAETETGGSDTRIEAADPSARRIAEGKDEGELANHLVQRGLPEDLANVYARAVKRGYVMLAVETEDRMSDAKMIMNDSNASDPIALQKEFEFLDRQG